MDSATDKQQDLGESVTRNQEQMLTESNNIQAKEHDSDSSYEYEYEYETESGSHTSRSQRNKQINVNNSPETKEKNTESTETVKNKAETEEIRSIPSDDPTFSISMISAQIATQLTQPLTVATDSTKASMEEMKKESDSSEYTYEYSDEEDKEPKVSVVQNEDIPIETKNPVNTDNADETDRNIDLPDEKEAQPINNIEETANTQDETIIKKEEKESELDIEIPRTSVNVDDMTTSVVFGESDYEHDMNKSPTTPQQKDEDTNSLTSNLYNAIDILTGQPSEDIQHSPKAEQKSDLSTPRKSPKYDEQKTPSPTSSRYKPPVSPFFQTTSNKVDLRLPPTPKTPVPSFVTQQMAPLAFRQMIKGTSRSPKRSGSNLNYKDVLYKKRQQESLLSHEEIKTLAGNILAGKGKKIDNPGTIADIVDELTNMKIDAMAEFNYKKSKQISDAITDLRMQFRIRDREAFQQERLEDLNKKINLAKDAIHQATQEWKQKKETFENICKSEQDEQEQRHFEDHQDLEDLWQQPKTIRKFSKKSPYLLQQLTIEKNLALVGNFTDAQAVQKINCRIEKFESEERTADMKDSFEFARERLIYDHAFEHQKLLHDQDLKRQVMLLQEKKDMEVYKNRLQALENVYAEESDYNKFVARKFKKSADFVLPMTCTLDGGSDIPPSGKSRVVTRDTENIMKVRAANVASPLKLPPLKFKKMKKPKKKNSSSLPNDSY